MQNAQVYVMVAFIGFRAIHTLQHISDLSASGPLKFPVSINGGI
jgi:hypothetical protein